MIVLKTWSGSYVELTWRVLPRWALGWIRSLGSPRESAEIRRHNRPAEF